MRPETRKPPVGSRAGTLGMKGLRRGGIPTNHSASGLARRGAGGSARAGITKRPLKLNEAIRERKAKLTVGGAPVFIMPGGGITFVVDVEQVRSPFFYWVPTPAVVTPIEYTMALEDYIAIGGHAHAIRPLEDVIEEMKKRKAGKS